MKKQPNILLSILAICLAGTAISTPGASALYIEEDGTTWYSVPELLEYKEEYDREARSTCGEDAHCLEELFFSEMESENPKFWALEQLTQQQIVVTSVNLTEETIKVLFFDEDMMLKHMGISEPLALGEFYMGWFDHDVERIYNYGMYAENLMNDALPGAHYLYAQRDVSENIIPANEEFLIDVAGSDLNLNSSGEIAYAAFAEPYFNAMGRFYPYGSCLLEPDYAEGTECRLMLSAEKGQRFFPPRETIEAEVESGSSTSPLAEEATENINKEDPKEENVIPEETLFHAEEIQDETSEKDYTRNEKEEIENNTLSALQNNEIFALGQLNQQSISSQTIKSPNTGTNTNPCNQRTVEFPWWLVILIALGDIVVLWLFWPKSHKKSKKVLDKNH